MYTDRLFGAMDVAPHITMGEPIPSLTSDGSRIIQLSELPSTEAFDDYDTVYLNPGYTEPTNAVIVPQDEFPALYDKCVTVVHERMEVWPHTLVENRDATLTHERSHGEILQALGAGAVLNGLRFAHMRTEHNEPVLGVCAYTIAPDLETFKLGVAAMLLAPADPSEEDLRAVQDYGYTPEEVRAKVRTHNAKGNLPYIPNF